ncbi:MAG TPA: hypothetical protein VFF73_19730 [Planctomycetota bacterium]|nr:hypothetical protein [Planctomycetota bacterium]
MKRRSPSVKKKARTRRYDPDAEKSRPMDPREAVATFLALLQQGANIDLAMGRDTYEMWRIAKGYSE